jgi:hypothetical protein
MENPKLITSRDQLRDKQPYLVGNVTSGDHPVQWEAYESWQAFVKDFELDDDDLDDLGGGILYIYELSWALSHHHRPHYL